jgi:hypothetical protein
LWQWKNAALGLNPWVAFYRLDWAGHGLPWKPVGPGPVPATLFALPEGFKVEDLGPKRKAQMAKSQ